MAGPVDGPGLREPSQRVSPRARLMWLVGAITRSGLLLLLLVAVGPVFDWVQVRWWWFLLAGVTLTAYVLVEPQWRYLVHRWEVTDTAVYTQTGWYSRERRIAPISRIQTVDYTEGAVARLFGLASVTVTTASAAGALVILGLDQTRARQLVDELTLKADADPGDAT